MMNENRPIWYEQLSEGPVRVQTFDRSKMNEVERAVFENKLRRKPGSRYGRLGRASMAAALAALVAAAVWAAGSGGWTGPVPSADPVRAARVYNPAEAKAGDLVGSMTVVSKEEGAFGKDSVTVMFAGSLMLEGTFEVASVLHPYEPGEVIFTPSAASAAKLPHAAERAGAALRFRLAFKAPADKASFGVPGTTGSATIGIVQYSQVSAPILEGTPDSAAVDRVAAVAQTPPPALGDKELAAMLKPYAPYRIGESGGKPDPAALGEWLNGAEAHFRLAPGEKTIGEAQKEQIREWLGAAFTKEAAAGVADRFTVPSGAGFVVAGGLVGLIPPGPVNALKDARISAEGGGERPGSYVFTMTFVQSGTQDAYLTCNLKEEGGSLKIDSWKIMYR